MSVLEEVNDAASRPGLGRALGSNVSVYTLARATTQCTHRISTEGAIFVRKLGQARPRALPDSFHATCQPSRYLLIALDPLFWRLASHEIELK